jgi:hypothetical protein
VKAREKTREHTSFHTSGGGDNWIDFEGLQSKFLYRVATLLEIQSQRNIKKNKVTDGS